MHTDFQMLMIFVHMLSPDREDAVYLDAKPGLFQSSQLSPLIDADGQGLVDVLIRNFRFNEVMYSGNPRVVVFHVDS